MGCNACVVGNLHFEIIVEGHRNFLVFPEVVRHLGRNGELVRSEGDTIVVSEAGMKDFLDFCHDHMDSENVFFRLDDGEWRPLTEAGLILDSQWIDEVILNELVTCHAQPILNGEGEIYAYEMLARFTERMGQ